MRTKPAIILLLLIALTAIFAEDTLLVWPLACKPQLTSTFGEFRVGHFHAGVDFRTPEGEGMPIFALRDGSVVRVRETPWGYGKVVYYQMDDGITAVFAHLSAFSDTIASLMNAEKYRKKSNNAELWFKEGQITYRRGDTLAFSGSSGAGSAHLHFETRQGMDNPVNPMDLGYFTADTLPPQIQEIWLIPRADGAQIEGKSEPFKIEIPRSNPESRKVNAHGGVSIAVNIRDRECDSNYNSFGAYIVRAIANSDTIFNFLADTISYSTTREIGLLYELGHQEEFGYKRPLFRLENPLESSITMLKSKTSGLLEIADDTLEVRIEAADYVGNISTATFTIIPQMKTHVAREVPDTLDNYDVAFSHRIFGVENIILNADFSEKLSSEPYILRNESEIAPVSSSDTTFSFRLFDVEPSEIFKLKVGGREWLYTPNLWRFESGMKYDLAGEWRIEIPENGVYRPFVASDTIIAGSQGDEFLRLDPAGVVLRRSAKLSIDTSNVEAEAGKACIVRIWNDDTFFVSNEVDDVGRIFGTISALGTFALAQDTIAPTLSLNITDSAAVSRNLTAVIKDDLSGFSNDVLPNSYIDGDWIPTEYDPEKNVLTVDLRDIEPGLHLWKVEAIDVCGNAVADSVRFVKR